MDVSGNYERFTEEQMEALERLYHECPKPSSIRLQQLIWEAPVLASIEPKQIKVWFQNRRRCREKQQKKKEPTRSLVSMNAKLTALNKLLVEENERLARHTSQLTLDNRMLRQQLHDLPPAAPGPDTQHSLLLNQEIRHQMKEERVNDEDSLLNALKDGGGDEKNTPRDHLSLQPIPGQNYYGVAAASTDDGNSDSVITVVGLPQNSTLQHYSPQDVHSAGRLLAVTDEMTLTEFLAKATRIVVDWIQLPSMKEIGGNGVAWELCSGDQYADDQESQS
ncbi:unnamed protein product [Sphagnum compactum]